MSLCTLNWIWLRGQNHPSTSYSIFKAMAGSELLYQSCKKKEGENSENSEVAAGMGLPRVNVAKVVQPWCLGMAPPPSAVTPHAPRRWRKATHVCMMEYDGGDITIIIIIIMIVIMTMMSVTIITVVMIVMLGIRMLMFRWSWWCGREDA